MMQDQSDQSDQSDHYVKDVQIPSFFWSVFSCIQSEYRKNSVFGHFSRSRFQSDLTLVDLLKLITQVLVQDLKLEYISNCFHSLQHFFHNA